MTVDLASIYLDGIFLEAATRLEAPKETLSWWSWPEVFSNTAGPRGGIGGQRMTTFQVYAFESEDGKRIMTCAGVWEPWNGEMTWRLKR